jgi:hypothetical protein
LYWQLETAENVQALRYLASKLKDAATRLNGASSCFCIGAIVLLLLLLSRLPGTLYLQIHRSSEISCTLSLLAVTRVQLFGGEHATQVVPAWHGE